MSKKIVLCLYIFFTITSPKCYSQNQQKIDSLLNVLKTAKDDTSNVDHLNDLGWELMYFNPDTAIILGNKALSIAEKSEWKKGISNSLGNLGTYYSIKGNYTKALDYYFNALKVAKELGDKKGIVRVLGNIGNVYDSQGDYLKALDYYLKALRMAEEIGDKNRIASYLGNIGNIYDDEGEHSKALDYHFKSLKMGEELGDKRLQANNLGNIGSVYLNQQDYAKALDYLFKGLKLEKELGDKMNLAITLGNIGSAYGMQGNYLKELDYQLQALKLREELGDNNGIAETLGNIGSNYTSIGKFKEAEAYFKKAIALDDSIGAKNDLRQFEESLSQLYDTTGRYKLALEHYKKAMALKDTLFNEAKSKQVTEMQAKYDSEKKEKEIALLTKDKEVQNVEIKKQKLLKYSLIGGLGLVLILAFLGYRTYRTRQLLKLQTLRNKIASDLHDDVGSTLSSISIFSEMAKEQSSEVTPMLEQIGDSSRKMLDAMADIVWTINPENDQFEKIILRMKSFAYELLGAKKIDFEFDADENVSELKLPMDVRKNLYLIFKEATNNMVKYAEANKASFSISGNKEKLTMFIRDNGKGFDVNKDSQGNGLKNMKKRAKEIGANLLIESETGIGTTIQLIINLA